MQVWWAPAALLLAHAQAWEALAEAATLPGRSSYVDLGHLHPT